MKYITSVLGQGRVFRMILIDYRENRSQVPQLLKDFQIPIQIADLPADYLLGKGCFVERKTMDDFMNSVADGRLFRQIDFLAKNCLNPLLILEGGYIDGRLSSNSFRGVILWISFEKRIPVIRSRNEYDSASILRLLAKKFGETADANPKLLKRKPKSKSFFAQQTDMLIQIPGIGRQTARGLLTYFGSIANLIQASDCELINLEGLGKERLQAIRHTFSKPVKSNEERD